MSTNLHNPSDYRKYTSRWPLVRGKQLFRVIDERSKDGTEELLTVSHITGITPRKQKNVTMFQSESLVGYKLCQIGDIAANTMWTWQGAIGVSEYSGVVSPAYNVYRQKGDIYNPRFLDLLLREHNLIEVYHSLSTGIRPSRLRLYPDVFLTIKFPLPPRDEQDAIVGFLDWKLSNINSIINQKRSVITRLEELKKVLIFQVATKGISTRSQMKYSGEAWIGLMPSQWNLGKSKRYVSIRNGSDPQSDGDTPVYGSGKGPFKTCGEYKTGPTVLLGRKGTIDKPVFVKGRYWNVDTSFDVKIISADFSLKYYYYLSNCFDYECYATQTAIPSMTQTDYENIKLPVPSITEQEYIVEYLDSRCYAIDSVIEKTLCYIDAVSSLKGRLISDVLSGKIDVRGIEIPEYEYVADSAESDENDVEAEGTLNEE